jgi:hypothetical protein
MLFGYRIQTTRWRGVIPPYPFLTSVLDVASGQCHAPVALYPRERIPGTHCIGDSVDFSGGLDTEAMGKVPCLCRGSNHGRPVVKSVVRHYTD